jgi:hypothetical protein
MIYPKLEPIDVIKLRPGDRVWLRGDVIEPVAGLCFINVVTEHDLVVVQPVQGHTFGHIEDATAVHPLEAENARLRKLLARFEVEIYDWHDCARIDAKMSGPVLAGWDRRQLDRCWERHVRNRPSYSLGASGEAGE